MNKERLTLLAKHLRTVTPENFDLGGWSCGTVSTGTPEEVLQAFAAALQGTTWAVHQSGDKTVTTAQPVQPPQNHVWAVSNKVAVMLFWSESAARQAGGGSGSTYMGVSRIPLADTIAQPVQPAPYAAIAGILNEVIHFAVKNGANSISMPDQYVEVALWLSHAETAAQPGEPANKGAI